MAVHGQRWSFQLENTLVHVDNAFTWSGWGQERVVINWEAIQSTQGWFRIRRAFREPWLTLTGDGELSVQLVATLKGVACKVELDGEPVQPEARFEATWNPRGSWPAEEQWKETRFFTAFGGMTR